MAKHKFIARVALKGDFDLDDGLGVAQQEVEAGHKASTDDKKLFDSLIEQGYAKKASARDEDDEAEAAAAEKSEAAKPTKPAGKK